MLKWPIKIGLVLATSSCVSNGSSIPEKREFPINEAVNPCDNFYRYACSKTIDSFQLRDDRSKHTFAFSDSRERLLEKKKEFLASLPQSQRMGRFRPQLKKLYLSCKNTDARATEENRFVDSLVKELDQLKEREAFLNFLASRRHNARFSFVKVGSSTNKDNPDIKDFYFSSHMMTLPERSYYENKEIRKDYLRYLQDFFATVGHQKPAKAAQAVFDLESGFAKNYPRPHELRKLYAKKTSIARAKVLNLYPHFKLKEDLQQIPRKMNIRHTIPETYAYVNRTLGEAPLENLKALYLYKALSPIMDEAYPDYFATKFAFNHKHLGGPKKRASLDERCTKKLMSSHRKEIDYELVDEIFPNFPEQDFIALAEKVRSSIIEGIQSNDWLSPKGKDGAIKKIKFAKLQLIKPRNDSEWYFNPELNYSANKFLENKVLLQQAQHKRMFEELGLKRDRNRWWMGPLTVNAYYSPSDNKFVMPIGILQAPFYDPNEAQIVNLGAVGAVIGHELGHGIDDNGAKYDYKGRLKQWMPDADIAKFKELGSQMISQFDEAGHNGKLTLGENIGDLVGLSFAYKAAFPKGQGKLSDKQRFFLQYARVWCGVTRPKMMKRQLKTGPHSLGSARVNQQVKHQGGFHEAFSCKKGDSLFLEKEKRLRIW